MRESYNSDGGTATDGQDGHGTRGNDPVVGNVRDTVEEEVLHKHVHDEDFVGSLSVGIEGVCDRCDCADEDAAHHDTLEESADISGCANLHEVTVSEHTHATADGSSNHVHETELRFIDTLVHLG